MEGNAEKHTYVTVCTAITRTRVAVVGSAKLLPLQPRTVAERTGKHCHHV